MSLTSPPPQPTAPPAQPTYILRGHTTAHPRRALLAAQHAAPHGAMPAAGWSSGTSPPAAPSPSGRAHRQMVLGVEGWGEERIVSHGRDGALRVWVLREDDEKRLATALPVESDEGDEGDGEAARFIQPELLHSVRVHAVNFCALAACEDLLPRPSPPAPSPDGPPDILVATPGVQDGAIHITALPGEIRIATISPPPNLNTGMLMAVALAFLPPPSPSISQHPSSPLLTVVAGYESGHASIWQKTPPFEASGPWQPTRVLHLHTQPILSVTLSPAQQRLLHVLRGRSAHAPPAPIPISPLPPPIYPPNPPRRPAIARAALRRRAPRDRGLGRPRPRLRRRAGDDRVAGADGEGDDRVAGADGEDEDGEGQGREGDREGTDGDEGAGVVTRRDTGRKSTVAERRTRQAQSTHWLAAGSKDGKVSLWEIF
ncbi:hypothetical protein MRB53_040787 [Persea americana]|nr:hypothetical protein MRB53_040787 [Persea americana]